jgi:hypothetical protein
VNVVRSRILAGTMLVLLALAFAFAGGSTASASTVSGDKNVWFGNVTIGAGDVVKGDLNVVFGDATCLPGGMIEGNVHTFGGTFTQLDGCLVGGQVNALSGDSVEALAPWPWWQSRGTVPSLFEENRRTVAQLAYSVIVVFVFLLFPMRVRIALDRVERHPALSALVGTLAFIAVLPVAILLVLSIIGIPLVVLEIAALFAGIWIGQGAVALLIGRRVYELIRPNATATPVGALIIGLIVVSAAELVPVVGWAVTALVWLVGLGAAVLAFVREATFQSFAANSQGISGNPPVPPVGGAPMKTV